MSRPVLRAEVQIAGRDPGADGALTTGLAADWAIVRPRDPAHARSRLPIHEVSQPMQVQVPLIVKDRVVSEYKDIEPTEQITVGADAFLDGPVSHRVAVLDSSSRGITKSVNVRAIGASMAERQRQVPPIRRNGQCLGRPRACREPPGVSEQSAAASPICRGALRRAKLAVLLGGRRNDQLDDPVASVDDQLSHGAAAWERGRLTAGPGTKERMRQLQISAMETCRYADYPGHRTGPPQEVACTWNVVGVARRAGRLLTRVNRGGGG
jgi:hypothetical protein